MPFGLKNAPAVFQHLIDTKGADGPELTLWTVFCFYVHRRYCYILVSHLAHLRRVLDRLLQIGLTQKPQKCHFLCTYPDSPQPSEGCGCKEYPVPKSVKEVRQFVCLASYYRRFIHGFAKVVQPLACTNTEGSSVCLDSTVSGRV